MTNGIGGPHHRRKAKEEAAKKGKAKDGKSSLKRKGLVPAALKSKQD
jgi:hypothetical protein